MDGDGEQTMRKVTERVVKAFMQGKSLTVGNTITDGKNIFLHGNHIARKNSAGKVEVRNAGYGTSTTRERLNGIARMYDSPYSFGQHRYDQVIYRPGARDLWDGEWTQIS